MPYGHGQLLEYMNFDFVKRKQSFPGQDWILSIFTPFLPYLGQNSTTSSLGNDDFFNFANILITYILLSVFFSRASGGMTWRRTLPWHPRTSRTFSLQSKPSKRHRCRNPAFSFLPGIRQTWEKVFVWCFLEVWFGLVDISLLTLFRASQTSSHILRTWNKTKLSLYTGQK